jgi:hypothetical protein
MFVSDMSGDDKQEDDEEDEDDEDDDEEEDDDEDEENDDEEDEEGNLARGTYGCKGTFKCLFRAKQSASRVKRDTSLDISQFMDV